MKFVYPNDDDRILHNAGHLPFSDAECDRLKANFRGGSIDPDSGVVCEPDFPRPFTPKIFWAQSVSLLFVLPEWRDAHCFTLPDVCKVGWLVTDTRGTYLAFDLKVLQQKFLEALDFSKSAFDAIKSASLDREAGPRVVSSSNEAKRMDDLEAARPGSAPLRLWLPRKAQVTTKWNWSAVAFDDLLFVRNDVDRKRCLRPTRDQLAGLKFQGRSS
ncbi:hypothetical protein, partial [Salipiger abyssi]